MVKSLKNRNYLPRPCHHLRLPQKHPTKLGKSRYVLLAASSDDGKQVRIGLSALQRAEAT